MMRIYELKFWYWLVRKLPKKIIYFCFMHVMAYATSGEYSKTVVPDLTCIEAIKRYSNENKMRL